MTTASTHASMATTASYASMTAAAVKAMIVTRVHASMTVAASHTSMAAATVIAMIVTGVHASMTAAAVKAMIVTRVHASMVTTASHVSVTAAAVIAMIVTGIHASMITSDVAPAAARTMPSHVNMIATTMRRMMYACRRTMHVMTAKASVPYRTAMSVETCMMVEAAVTASVGNPYAGTTVVEVVAIVVAIDGEEPAACTPSDRTEEIVGCKKQAVLPVVQDAAQVVQTIVVITTIEVGRRTNPQKIVEVDFVGIVILLVVEVEFVCHLVRQVEGFCLCATETHCIGTRVGYHRKHQGENNLFHSSVVLIV